MENAKKESYAENFKSLIDENGDNKPLEACLFALTSLCLKNIYPEEKERYLEISNLLNTVYKDLDNQYVKKLITVYNVVDEYNSNLIKELEKIELKIVENFTLPSVKKCEPQESSNLTKKQCDPPKWWE